MAEKPVQKESRRKVIMVDDVGFLLMSAKERLKERYEIFPATSAEALFKILEKTEPEIILLDINMPDMNGYEIIKKLKAQERFADIPVIFLSGNNDRKSIIKGRSHGAVDFITKPFKDSDLIECIEFQLNPEMQEKNKPLVLAVDDNPSILKAINSILNQQYVVRTLSNPLVLEELLKVMVPDLFLLDCKMPGLQGFDLVPIIRKTAGHEETPIVFLTSEGTIDNISVAISQGASDFILKPIDEEILREKIATHLSDFVMKRRIRSSKQ
ncbi:MAG: response regulator [Oscillospiraceae bacterium]|nr:response regulator [Oscillospiraceae bacterium]